MRLPPLPLVVMFAAFASACGGVSAPSTHHTFNLGAQDAGHTVQVQVGDNLVVTLEDNYPVPGSSLVWNVSSPDAMLGAGPATRSPQVRSGPGAHDTYTAVFRAMASGQGVLEAHGATSCEAMVKTSCPDRDFTITVVITS